MGESDTRWMSLTGWARRDAEGRGLGRLGKLRRWFDSWKAIRAGRPPNGPLVYISVILCAMLAAYAYKVRTNGILACDVSGYTSDRYLAFCPKAGYGDYDHGAFLFKLEPLAFKSASDADVLFLGDSHIQYAFSTDVTSQWFTSASARYYLLGFIFGENVTFTEPLLREMK